MDDSLGLRDVRQNASELVRRAQAGERITITVSGRPAAILGPVGVARWRRWAEVSDALTSPIDDDWARERDLVDQQLRVPEPPGRAELA